MNHKNGRPGDDRAENLEWITKSENERHKYDVLGQRGARTGHTQSRETRDKIAASLRGGKRNVKTRNKMSRSALGHVVSAETKEKIAASQRARHSRLRELGLHERKPLSEKTKRKISAAHKRR